MYPKSIGGNSRESSTDTTVERTTTEQDWWEVSVETPQEAWQRRIDRWLNNVDNKIIHILLSLLLWKFMTICKFHVILQHVLLFHYQKGAQIPIIGFAIPSKFNLLADKFIYVGEKL